MRKILALLLAGLLALMTGCAQDIASLLVSRLRETPLPSETAESAPEFTPEPAPFAPAEISDSRVNGWREVTDGGFLYYNRYDPNGLRRSAPPFAEEETLFAGGYNHLSLAGDTLYFWSYSDELYRVTGDGEAELLYDPSADLEYFDVSGSWYAGGKLYFLAQEDFLTNTLRIYDCASGAVTVTDLVFDNGFPDILVYGDWLYYTRYREMEEDSQETYNDLCRASLADLSLRETVAEYGHSPHLFDGVLYYTVFNIDADYREDPDGVVSHFRMDLSTGETGAMPGGTKTPYWVEGGYVYCAGGEEDPSTVRIPLAGGPPETLFTGASPTNRIVKVGDYLYMDYYDGLSHQYFLTAIGQPQAVLAEDVLPYAAPDPTPVPSENADLPSALYLSTGEKSGCYKLFDEWGSLVFTIKLDPHSSVTKYFGAGKYTLRIAEGDTWISDEEAFGDEGEYYVTDLFTFLPGMTYTIGTGPAGNVYGSSKDGFTG